MIKQPELFSLKFSVDLSLAEIAFTSNLVNEVLNLFIPLFWLLKAKGDIFNFVIHLIVFCLSKSGIIFFLFLFLGVTGILL